MATIGLSKPYYAIYAEAGGVVSYSDGAVMGKATEANISIETTEDNNLYGDNGLAETDRRFANGTLTLSTTDLSQEVSKAILGLTEQAITGIDGVTDTSVKELVYDDAQVTPYLGVGFIIKKKVNGAYKWRGVVLPKVMFSVPEDAATTQGESIEWQTPELTGAIMRDDSATHMWKREATFTTEAQAEAYIKNRLSITVAA
jgi:phi13 family phage major tail protein